MIIFNIVLNNQVACLIFASIMTSTVFTISWLMENYLDKRRKLRC
jgi:hypothetical protein